MSTDDQDPRSRPMARLFGIATRRSDVSTDGQSLFDTLVARAAVVGTFTPRGLTVGLETEESVNDALQQVLDKSAVVTVDRQRRWMLEPTMRSTTFARLGRHAVRVLEGFKPEFQDPLSMLLEQLLRGQVPKAEGMPLGRLRILVNAAHWVTRASDVASQMLATWQQELQRRELLDPLRVLVGTHFSGRVKELKILRDYVDIVAPTSMFNGWSRWLSRALTSRADRPLLLYGVGGIGKSTLLAHFILEHAAVIGERGFPFVYLDFDRSVLDPMNGLSLLTEAARQLEGQFPAVAASFRDFQANLMDRASTSRIEQGSASPLAPTRGMLTDRRALADASRAFLETLMASGLADRPFLLVLDTFEEVQARGELAVDTVFDWLDTLCSRHRIKTIIAGRAQVPDRPLARDLCVGNLNKASALQFLATNDVSPDLAQEVFARLGGNPLSLKLAIRLLRVEDSRPGEWINVGRDALLKGLDDVRIQGYLQTRLLVHIHDERVRALAHPGLILRRITPEIIQSVLAPAMQLAVQSRKEAQDLYDGLRREVSLVVEQDHALVHLREPRSVMLPLQKAKDPQLFQRLNAAAVEYYRGRELPQDRIEHTYHRLMMEENPYDVFSNVSLDVVRGLGSSTEDLPADASLVVRLLLGRPVTKAEARQLPDYAWEMYAFQAAVRLLSSGALQRPLALLKERAHLVDSPLLAYPLALALFRSLDWNGADAALQRAASYRPPAHAQLPFEVFDSPNIDVRARVERGYLLWYQYQDAAANRQFEEAYSMSTQGRDRALKIEALLGSLAIGSQRKPLDKEQYYTLRASLMREVSAMPDTEWRVNLATLRRVAFLGCAGDVAARMAVSFLGLQLRSRDTITEFLSEFESDLDAGLAKRLLSHIQDGGWESKDNFLARMRTLAVLERDIATHLVRSDADLARRAIPFVRGRYTAWRIPIRSGLMQVFPKFQNLTPGLTRTLPDLGTAFDNSSAAFSDRVDDAIEIAEYRDQVLELVYNCTKCAEELGYDAEPLRLVSGALKRYSGVLDTSPDHT
jgi:hypothetical protein